MAKKVKGEKKEKEAKLMSVTVKKKDLLDALELVKSVSLGKSSLPILNNVLLSAGKKNGFEIVGTNLEISVSWKVPIAGFGEEGQMALPSKKLYEILKEMPDGSIGISGKKNFWCTVKSGKTEFNLVGLDPEEFPTLPKPESSEKWSLVKAEVLVSLFDKTVFAACNEESRYHLNGLLISNPKDDVLRMVGTDGHRISLAQQGGSKIEGLRNNVIIPKKGVLFLLKWLRKSVNEVEVLIGKLHMFFRMGNVSVIIRLIDGEFPEYNCVIPKDCDKIMTVNSKELCAVLKRVGSMSHPKIGGVLLNMKKDRLTVSATNQDTGEVKETMKVGYQSDPLQVGVNHRYLEEAVGSFDSEEVKIAFKNKDADASPILVLGEGSSQLSVVMPMRI